MAIEEITREALTNVCLIGLSAVTLGAIAYGGIKLYRNTKAINRMFDSAAKDYRDDFNKDELLKFYERMQIDFRRNLVGKRGKSAEEICGKLEDQIMTYAAQETFEYVSKGNTLDFENPLESASPLYLKARAIYDKSHSPRT